MNITSIPYGPEPLKNNPLKDGVCERRPVMNEWEKRTTQLPSEVYIEKRESGRDAEPSR